MPPRDSEGRFRRVLHSDLWLTVLPAVILVAGAFAFTLLFVKPAPPTKIVIAVAPDEGGSRYYARRYQEILKRYGITLDVRQTGGSLANVKLLADPHSGVDVAFVQSGTAGSAEAPHVVSLGSVAYVPLWVFHRLSAIGDISELKGHRIAVGSAESGTRALAIKLLAASGSDKPPTELLASERDEVLLSPTANLLVRDNLHPALAYLLLRAASEVHGTPGLLDQAREFPSPRDSGFPISPAATRYYQAGLPFLQRYLPFWAAVLVDRLWVFLLPIIAVAVPLARIVPALYRWRVRSRVFRWYGRLKQIELQLEEGPGIEQLREMLKRLDDTDLAVNKIPTPLAYADNLYFFREHVDVVRRRIVRRLNGDSAEV